MICSSTGTFALASKSLPLKGFLTGVRTYLVAKSRPKIGISGCLLFVAITGSSLGYFFSRTSDKTTNFTLLLISIVRHLPTDTSPVGLLPVGLLPIATFADRDICRSRHLPVATFADRDICRLKFCRSRHLPVATFAGRDICRSRHLPVATFAGRDICRSRHLPVATFAGRDICRSELLITLSIEQDHAGSSG